MTHIQFDYKKALAFSVNMNLSNARSSKNMHHVIHDKTGAGSDFLGWVDLPVDYDKEEFDKFLKLLNVLKSNQMYC